MAPTRNNVQSLRWWCSNLSSITINNLVKLLQENIEVQAIVWGDSTLFVELKKKKTASYFAKRYPVLEGKLTTSKSLEECISSEEIRGKIGNVSIPARLRVSMEKTKVEESLSTYYDYCVDSGERPTVEGRDFVVSYSLHKSQYETVTSFAMKEVRKSNFNLEPLPWQKMALKLAEDQEERKVSNTTY